MINEEESKRELKAIAGATLGATIVGLIMIFPSSCDSKRDSPATNLESSITQKYEIQRTSEKFYLAPERKSFENYRK